MHPKVSIKTEPVQARLFTKTFIYDLGLLTIPPETDVSVPSF